MKPEVTSMQTKRALAASLKSIMAHKPFSKITVTEIIDDCGVNRKTFYYHFENIYALLHWMLEQESVEILKHFNLMTDYRDAVSFVMDYIESNRHIINCALDSGGRDELHRFFFKDFMGIADSVLRGMEEKYWQKLPDEYRSFMAEFYCEAIVGMIVSWIRNRKCRDRDFIQESIISILRDSLRGVIQTRSEVHTEQSSEWPR